MTDDVNINRYTYRQTRTKYSVPHKLEYKNGYPIVKAKPVGIGAGTLDVESVRYVKNPAPGLYDPKLTYGKCKRDYVPPFKPRFVQYDKQCLSFKGYFTQEVPNSPEEKHRVRKIELIYFLEDDTLLVREPAIEIRHKLSAKFGPLQALEHICFLMPEEGHTCRTKACAKYLSEEAHQKTAWQLSLTPILTANENNAGFPQGRLVTRGKVLKDDGETFHWKDINNRMTIPINGTDYNLCSCDRFTREYLESQGIEVEEDAEIPEDPYLVRRTMQNKAGTYAMKPPPDKYTKFLMYDKKVLRFTGLWDNRACEYGDIEEYHVLYYPEDDTMEILKRTKRREREPTAPLLARIKVPKNWKKLRATFPAESLENFYEHREETYLPQDLIVGKTIDVFGRKINLVDCDKATRAFYERVLHITQPLPSPRIEQTEPTSHFPQALHDRLRDDILPEWHKFTPQLPKTDLVCYLNNMNKTLRYSAKLDVVHPEDEGRRFIIEYRLSDGCLKIIERKLRNTGFRGGKFLGYQLVPKPNSKPEDPEFYTPMDLGLDGVINVFGHRFIITGADLAVYRYMQENTEKFKPEIINNFHDYLVREGLLDPPEEVKSEPKIEVQEKEKATKCEGDIASVKTTECCQRRCRFADE